MILVNHISYCQYPTTKIINGDSVIVLTIEQGDNINTSFLSLKKELSNTQIKNSNLLDSLCLVKHDLNKEKRKLDSLQKNFLLLHSNTLYMNHKVELYKEEIKQKNKEKSGLQTFAIITLVFAWTSLVFGLLTK